MIRLDLLVAFDTISHGIFPEQLSDLDVRGTILQLILWERSQRVLLDVYSSSSPWTSAYSVPQGLVLSPILFIMSIKPLDEVVREFGLKCHHQYADILYGSISQVLRGQ